MKQTSITQFLLGGTLLLGVSSPILAQTRGLDIGKREFETSCASCHGVNGKGSGTVTPWLRKSPPDLTLLSKANGGIFPMDRLYKSVSGEDTSAHGSREMPVWGQVYRMSAAEYYMEQRYNEEAIVRARILSLLEYINRLQVTK